MIASFENVHLRYGREKPVLEDISFGISSGSFHFLTGPSGAGKSSLLRLLYMSELPTKGNINLFGRNTSELKRDDLPAMRRRLGVVFQDFRLIPHLTALENASLPLRLAGAEDRQIRQHVIELLDWVGLHGRLNAMPHELSGGEQQRVAIARAVVNKPSLLLADEPTGNVDDEAALKLLHLFVELNRMGTTILLATHQPSLVEKIGKPSLHLRHGKLYSVNDPAIDAREESVIGGAP